MHYESIICIGDTQAPFHHKDYLDFLLCIKESYKSLPKKTKIIHLGDEVDFHAYSSKYPVDPDGYSPGHELEQALMFMHDLYDIFPETDVCISNHTMRPLVKAFKAGIPKAFIKDFREFLDAPRKWRWEQSWIYNNIKFEHGENVSGPHAALRAAEQNRMSTVIGHQHSNAGVIYSNNEQNQIFGMNVGCGIDVDAYAFAYGKNSRNKPVLGAGVILDNIPQFIPMILDANKKWIGHL